MGKSQCGQNPIWAKANMGKSQYGKIQARPSKSKQGQAKPSKTKQNQAKPIFNLIPILIRVEHNRISASYFYNSQIRFAGDHYPAPRLPDEEAEPFDASLRQACPRVNPVSAHAKVLKRRGLEGMKAGFAYTKHTN
jgi:hypothetical protein